MTRIAHISDLHFGTEDHELLGPLRIAIRQARPDLVAVSGDLTQRARPGQFRAARAFLDGLGLPWISVPGNHDIPLDEFWHRALHPFGRYRAEICADLAPRWSNGLLVLEALNTADPRAWQRGRVRRRQLWRAGGAFREAPEGSVNVVMAHHPFEHGPDEEKRLMRNARMAVEHLAEAGADLILSGHLHRWRAEPFLSRKVGARVLQVHVGTGLSTRLRGQVNDFALIAVAPGQVEITRMVARDGEFLPHAISRFRRAGDVWLRGGEG
ncbi:metallophosphoesterase [Roseibacterium sp. SDUM158017]|uniref:metallophosphoesterase family protein n=1 Tax=Roseicyclus salinarum TaxID=3036773 RepID=UPI0024154325|nr:metallophosphoesterase [Roseibacterium sp. SDUM158017]MDG4649708.1 metallophosphoesterase [Roseibacterium sp. SDUM158017]